MGKTDNKDELTITSFITEQKYTLAQIINEVKTRSTTEAKISFLQQFPKEGLVELCKIYKFYPIGTARQTRRSVIEGVKHEHKI